MHLTALTCARATAGPSVLLQGLNTRQLSSRKPQRKTGWLCTTGWNQPACVQSPQISHCKHILTWAPKSWLSNSAVFHSHRFHSATECFVNTTGADLGSHMSAQGQQLHNHTSIFRKIYDSSSPVRSIHRTQQKMEGKTKLETFTLEKSQPVTN